MTGMRQAAVFDFDGTVIRGDSVTALLFYARKKQKIGLFTLMLAGVCGGLYRLHLMDAATAKRHSHAFLTRMETGEREAFLQDFARSLVGRAYPDALAEITAHRDQGHLVVICSASGQCYMRYAARLLQADALLCTPCGEDGGFLGPNCRGEEKVRRMTAWLQENGLTQEAILAAYGDTKGDAPLLRMSQMPVLVNPKRALKKALPSARQVCWKAQEPPGSK